MNRLLLLLLLLPAASSAQAPSLSGYDVFVVAGQSNAYGHGDSTLSVAPPPGTAFEYDSSGHILPLADPVGQSRYGSAWPAFARAYTALTARGVIVAERGAGWSPQTTSGATGPDVHWDVRPSAATASRLFPLASAAGPAAAARATMDGFPDVRFRGWIWCQGETDGWEIDQGRIQPGDYQAAFAAMRDSLWRALPAGAALYLIETGRMNGGDTPGYQAVRAAQAAAVGGRVVLAFDQAVTFPERGMMIDDFHWRQSGLDEAGTATARAVAFHLFGIVGSEDSPAPAAALALYPNPARQGQSVTVGAPFQVVDALGREVASGDAWLGTGSLPAGVYAVRSGAVSARLVVVP